MSPSYPPMNSADRSITRGGGMHGSPLIVIVAESRQKNQVCFRPRTMILSSKNAAEIQNKEKKTGNSWSELRYAQQTSKVSYTAWIPYVFVSLAYWVPQVVVNYYLPLPRTRREVGTGGTFNSARLICYRLIKIWVWGFLSIVESYLSFWLLHECRVFKRSIYIITLVWLLCPQIFIRQPILKSTFYISNGQLNVLLLLISFD